MSPALLLVWRITDAGTPPEPLSETEIVEDVEALCRGVVREARNGHMLSGDDVDQTVAELFERVVILTAQYDRSRAGILFRPWLYRELRRDAIDYWRCWFGRAGQKRVFDDRLLTSDQAVDGSKIDPVDAVEDDGDSGKRRRDEAHAAITSDDLADRVSALGGLLDEGDRGADRALRRLRFLVRETTPRRARRADRGRVAA